MWGGVRVEIGGCGQWLLVQRGVLVIGGEDGDQGMVGGRGDRLEGGWGVRGGRCGLLGLGSRGEMRGQGRRLLSVLSLLTCVLPRFLELVKMNSNLTPFYRPSSPPSPIPSLSLTTHTISLTPYHSHHNTHHNTNTISLTPYHSHHITHTITPYHSHHNTHHNTNTISLTPYHSHHITHTISLTPYTHTITLTPYHSHHITHTITLTPYHSHHNTHTISLTPYHSHHNTHTISLTP